MEVLGASEELPLIVFGDQEYPEETRLRYRFLDLRREKMQRNMKLRSDVVGRIRRRMWDRAFASSRRRSSPPPAPKARATSWCPRGCIRASSTRCRRRRSSSSSSSWSRASTSISRSRPVSATRTRAPTARPTDFYQLDMEMSFVEQEDVFDTIEPVIKGVFEEFGGVTRSTSTGRRSYYDEALLVRDRQARPAQPGEDAGGVRAFRGLRLRHLREDPGA
jgi:aspartyl-tRNA synthetase